MERHHFAQSMCILNTEGCNILENINKQVGIINKCLSHEVLEMLHHCIEHILKYDTKKYYLIWQD